MSGNILIFLILAVCFLAAGLAVGRCHSARPGSAGWVDLAVCVAFLLSGAMAVAAGFMILLYYC